MLNKKYALYLLTAISLSGCCEIKTVYVPVSSCAEPPPFTAPTLLVDNLLPTATTQDKLQALKIDHGTMRQAIEQCKVLLDAYRTPSPTPPKEKTD